MKFQVKYHKVSWIILFFSFMIIGLYSWIYFIVMIFGCVAVLSIYEKYRPVPAPVEQEDEEETLKAAPKHASPKKSTNKKKIAAPVPAEKEQELNVIQKIWRAIW